MSSASALFGVYTVILLAANASVIASLANLARHDHTASHVVLVPLVTLALIYQDRRTIFSSYQPARALGACIVLLGLGVLAVGYRAATAGMPDS